MRTSSLVRFSRTQVEFLKANEVCRLATASKTGAPQVTPVIYALDTDAFVIAVDYGTRKLTNLRRNPIAALVVDEYGKENKAVAVQGSCQILERGPEYRRLLRVLFERFESYRNNPWKEGEAPILRISPRRIVSWGLSHR